MSKIEWSREAARTLRKAAVQMENAAVGLEFRARSLREDLVARPRPVPDVMRGGDLNVDAER